MIVKNGDPLGTTPKLLNQKVWGGGGRTWKSAFVTSTPTASVPVKFRTTLLAMMERKGSLLLVTSGRGEGDLTPGEVLPVG